MASPRRRIRRRLSHPTSGGALPILRLPDIPPTLFDMPTQIRLKKPVDITMPPPEQRGAQPPAPQRTRRPPGRTWRGWLLLGAAFICGLARIDATMLEEPTAPPEPTRIVESAFHIVQPLPEAFVIELEAPSVEPEVEAAPSPQRSVVRQARSVEPTTVAHRADVEAEVALLPPPPPPPPTEAELASQSRGLFGKLARKRQRGM